MQTRTVVSNQNGYRQGLANAVKAMGKVEALFLLGEYKLSSQYGTEGPKVETTSLWST